MALNEVRLAEAIKQVLTSNPGGSGEIGIEYFSQRLAQVLIAEIRQATVQVQSGQNVQVVYPAGTGATISPGTGTII
jgi:hypothetical protein